MWLLALHRMTQHLEAHPHRCVLSAFVTAVQWAALFVQHAGQQSHPYITCLPAYSLSPPLLPSNVANNHQPPSLTQHQHHTPNHQAPQPLRELLEREVSEHISHLEKRRKEAVSAH